MTLKVDSPHSSTIYICKYFWCTYLFYYGQTLSCKEYLPGREYEWWNYLRKNCLNDQIFFGTEKMTSWYTVLSLVTFQKITTCPSKYERTGVYRIRFPTQGSRTDIFLLLSYFEWHVLKKREKRICKHLLQASCFRPLLLCGHTARCYAVKQCCFYLASTTKRPAKPTLGA